jgi:hypothetical protein
MRTLREDCRFSESQSGDFEIGDKQREGLQASQHLHSDIWYMQALSESI